MEEKYRELSADYYKRKQHLFKKRLKFLFILFSSVSFLLFLSISEGYALKLLLSKNFSFIEISVILILISIYLLAYNIILSKIYLHICYYFENKKTPSLIIMTIFIILYLTLSYTTGIKDIVSLGVSKLCIISLYFHFWNSQLTEARLKTRSKLIPYIFIVSWRAFFICRWVLISCWLLSSLGFALALVASHPIIKLEGWEGLILMITFYFLFKLFVRNPNAHNYY
ncbi:hypothetical protein GCL60_15780 [Silvanigrella paludirubra]|jgi:hypothetical protein|uniref:Uncharacterized protein n=1 Tax=Silvanigrella paludirubra TaxID=2499159 RepID=A0A6N6VN53_9BACT|nr:hypothetical protein [Silvanigrella paludirubra]KAB8036244.1 hypothetical protein GCL60_15780 [Silvanigrella paludirubra]